VSEYNIKLDYKYRGC